MSRFDLFFVVCDESNYSADANLCDFLINMHRGKKRAVLRKYDYKTLRLYIALARRLNPMLTHEAAKTLR